MVEGPAACIRHGDEPDSVREGEQAPQRCRGKPSSAGRRRGVSRHSPAPRASRASARWRGRRAPGRPGRDQHRPSSALAGRARAPPPRRPPPQRTCRSRSGRPSAHPRKSISVPTTSNVRYLNSLRFFAICDTPLKPGYFARMLCRSGFCSSRSIASPSVSLGAIGLVWRLFLADCAESGILTAQNCEYDAWATFAGRGCRLDEFAGSKTDPQTIAARTSASSSVWSSVMRVQSMILSMSSSVQQSGGA